MSHGTYKGNALDLALIRYCQIHIRTERPARTTGLSNYLKATVVIELDISVHLSDINLKSYGYSLYSHFIKLKMYYFFT